MSPCHPGCAAFSVSAGGRKSIKLPAADVCSGKYLVENGIATFACSESQKIGHVTFFWNGNRAEVRVRCPSVSCRHRLHALLQLPSNADCRFGNSLLQPFDKNLETYKEVRDLPRAASIMIDTVGTASDVLTSLICAAERAPCVQHLCSTWTCTCTPLDETIITSLLSIDPIG